MPRLRGAAVTWLLVVALVGLTQLPAFSVTASLQSDEIGGTTATARTTAEGLRSAWAAQVVANGGAVSAPITFSQPTYTSGAAVTGVINTAADGTTTTLERTRYSAGSAPTYVGASPNPGTAMCTTSGTSLQGGAPRPTSLVSNTACSNAPGFAYAMTGGSGDQLTRDAVEFTFSRPVLGFGAWFGDLETRTTGGGVAALVRLYGADGVLLSDRVVEPGPRYLPQSNCSSTFTGCGNNTTRWLGFVADPAQPVQRMVVIVGDEDVNGSGLDEGLGLIGPTLDLSTAAIALTKSALPLTDTNADGVLGGGDTVNFEFAVTNTGTLAVSDVTITDAFATGITCPAGPLAAGAVRTCMGSHLLTQTEVDAGEITNTARASAAAYAGRVASEASTAVVPILATPVLRVTKTVSDPTFDEVGDQVSFEIIVENTGNVTLSGLSVSDPNPGTGDFGTNCGEVSGSLSPGASAACRAAYTVTQADLDKGTVTNVATAQATAPGRVSVGPVSGNAASTAIQRVGFTLQKTVDEPTYDAVGDVLNYTMSVTNDGNVTLRDVVVLDPNPGGGAFASNCDAVARTLAPAESDRCTATYVVTQDDLENGSVTNLADAAAEAPGGPVEAREGTATSTVLERPGLSIVKTVDSETYSNVGEVLTYSVVVTNQSNVRVNTVQLADDAPGDGAFNLNCTALPAALNAGASGSCTATYTVTQADIDGGRLTNEAQASARLPSTLPVVSPLASVSSAAVQSAALSLIKTVDTDSFEAVGEVLTFTLTVTNSGNVTLPEAEVIDAAPGAGAFDLDCPDLPGTLAPGDETTCTATYAVTQTDLDAGLVTNTASAQASSPGGLVTTPESSATASARQLPLLGVTKVVDELEFTSAGDVLNYEMAVDNLGNVTLSAVSLVDEAPGTGDFTVDCTGLPAVLAPGEVGNCTARYVVSQVDVDSGSVVNSAFVEATAPTGPVNTRSADVTSISLGAASLEIIKNVEPATYDTVGQLLVYTIIVNNTGDLTLNQAAVSDETPGTGEFVLDCLALTPELAPDHSGICQATYAVTQADLDAGDITNEATASAITPQGEPLTMTASAVATAVSQRALEITNVVAEKSYGAAGDVLNYTITVRNPGNVTLTRVKVKDKAPGVGRFRTRCGVVASLAPGMESVCRAKYRVTVKDLKRPKIIHTATASLRTKASLRDTVTPVSASAKSRRDLRADPGGSGPGSGGPGNSGPGSSGPDSDGTDGSGVDNLGDTGAPEIRLPVELGLIALGCGLVLSFRSGRRRYTVAG